MQSRTVGAPLSTGIGRLQMLIPRLPSIGMSGMLLLIASAIVLALFVRAVRESDPAFSDFSAYYAAAGTLPHGDQLYRRALAWRDAGYTISHPTMPPPTEGFPYVYPPVFAFVVLPLTLLPLNAAYIIWLALMLGCLVGAAYVLVRQIFPFHARHRWLATLALSSAFSLFQPIRAGIWAGQADFVVLLLLTLAMSAFVSRREHRAGLWLGLAAAIKPTVGFVVLLYVWKGAYRAAIIACIVPAVLFVLPTILVGPGVLADFVTVARYWSSPVYGVSPVNQSPYSLFLRLFSPNPFTVPVAELPMLPVILHGAVVLVTLITLAMLISRSRAPSVHQRAVEYGLICVATLLVSPLSEDHHYSILALPFAALAAVAVSVGLQPARTLGGRLGAWGGSRPDHVPALSGRLIALSSTAALTYAYFSLPSLHPMKMAFYGFYAGPVGAPSSFLTGVHVYGLVSTAVVTALTLCWYRSSLPLPSVRSDQASPGSRDCVKDDAEECGTTTEISPR